MSNDAWDQVGQMADRHAAQGGIFVKLANDGDKVVGCFLGQPFAREVIWDGTKYALFDENNPEHRGKKATLRVGLNFLLLPERQLKVFEFGTSLFKDLSRIRGKFDLSRWAFEVARSGAPKDPSTQYHILPDRELTEAEQREIARLELHDLQRVLGGDATGDAPAFVDEQVAKLIADRLRALPRECVEDFLKRFAIGRIRELPKSRVADSFALLDAMEAKRKPQTQTPQGEVDPFQ
jgi:hypothetical protein